MRGGGKQKKEEEGSRRRGGEERGRRDGGGGRGVFFFQQKTAYEVLRSLVGSEMCIRGGPPPPWHRPRKEASEAREATTRTRTRARAVLYTHLTLPTNREV